MPGGPRRRRRSRRRRPGPPLAAGPTARGQLASGPGQLVGPQTISTKSMTMLTGPAPRLHIPWA
eukprot:15212340-Alexandrium_andersonii.AAC.1